MRANRLLIAGVCAAACAAWLASCRPAETPLEPPAQQALLLFDLARNVEADEAQVDSLFDANDDEAWRADLFDALDQLADVADAEIERVVQLEAVDRTAVDVVCTTGAGGQARYSVQLAENEEGQWKIVAFDGPGVSWPPRSKPRGTGLSTWPEREP
jgi:hypothetical protein